MADRGMLIVLSGPSGVGKGTIVKELLRSRPDCVLSVSAATRAPRAGERDGVEYFFMSREEFGELVARGEILEYAEYSGNCYGTPAKAVENQRNAGNHVILEIEVQGALQIREKCPDAVMIFILPPSMEALRLRLEGRGTECAQSVERRMAAAREEIEMAGEYQYVIVNTDVQECCRQLSAVITAAGCATDKMKDTIQEVLDHA